MGVRELRVARHGLFQLFAGLLVFVKVEVSFAEQQVEVRRVAAGADELLEGAALVVPPCGIGFAVGDAEHEQVIQIGLLVSGEGLKRIDRGLVLVQHEVAHALEIARLGAPRVRFEHSSEMRNGGGEIIFVVVGEAQVQINSDHARRQLLCRVKRPDGFSVFFSSQVADAEVAVGGGRTRVELQDFAEPALRRGVIPRGQCLRGALEDGLRGLR